MQLSKLLPKVTDPYSFSFRDMIAIPIILYFIGLSTYYVSINPAGLFDIIKIWSQLVALIVGGYFGQEMVSTFSDGWASRAKYNTIQYGPVQTGSTQVGPSPGTITDNIPKV